MKSFILNRMAAVDLARRTVEYRFLPEGGENGPASLSNMFPDAMIFCAGALTGSYAPASGLVTVLADGAVSFVKGHAGQALRRCGLDAVVITGTVDCPSALILDGISGWIEPMDCSLSVPEERKILCRKAKQHEEKSSDALPFPILTGPAAFLECTTPALALDVGIAPRTSAAARSMARRCLTGICLNGHSDFISPIPLEHPARKAVTAARVSTQNIVSLLKAAYSAYSGKSFPVNSRSLACYACPVPCGFWLPLEHGYAACTSLEAIAMLTDAGASPTRSAELLNLGETYGVDAAALCSLVSGILPDTAEACAAVAAPLADTIPDMGAAVLGVCPFFLQRFPAVRTILAEEVSK